MSKHFVSIDTNLDLWSEQTHGRDQSGQRQLDRKKTVDLAQETHPGGQFNRHLEFKAWVKAQLKAGVKDAFRKAPDRAMVKAWVKA